jgi:hypothetical protein
MNFFEKQAKLQKELFDIQTKTTREMMDLNEQSMAKYLSLNEEFAAKMPEGADLSAWGELQREYGETVWSGVQSQMEATGEVLKSAVEAWNEAITTAYNPEVEAANADAIEEAPAKAPAKKKAA